MRCWARGSRESCSQASHSLKDHGSYSESRRSDGSSKGKRHVLTHTMEEGAGGKICVYLHTYIYVYLFLNVYLSITILAYHLASLGFVVGFL